ncbi:phenylalanine--tRNA ligase subunit beta [archaeon]|nr:phenylalanine--tRNA ligase subunit beta [archaeon]
MPTLEISYRDLCDLVGKNIDIEKLKDEDILFAKCEIDEVVGDVLKVDTKDTNRPDLWSTEGIAREIRYRYRGGFPEYKTKKSGVGVIVDKSVRVVRPFTACAVVRGLKVVLSMPPIINSAYTGKVTEKTKNVFIECSGFDMRFLKAALNVMVTALYERGGKIETVNVIYDKEKFIMPDLTPKKFTIETKYIKDTAGVDIDEKDIIRILSKSGYKVSGHKKLNLSYPAYRQDIMHSRDVVEDVIISYGLNKIEPTEKKLSTTGKLMDMEVFTENIYDIMIGSGLQEILSYTLTNKKDVFNNMNVNPGAIAEIDNSISFNWSVFRNWMLPGLMDFLSRNKHIEYPQKIFEIGTCVLIDEDRETKAKDEIKLAAAITNSIVNYEDISSILDSLMRNIGMKYKLKTYKHDSFISGRCAEIIIGNKQAGFIGEINPAVLNNWKLDKPVVAFELDLSYIFAIKNESRMAISES